MTNYLNRNLILPLDKNIILFGARNTGKSTLLRHTFSKEKSFWIDLLKLDEEDKYRILSILLRSNNSLNKLLESFVFSRSMY